MSRLILWDVMLQHDFVSPLGKCPVPDAGSAAVVCVALIAAARAAGIPRVAVVARRRLEAPDITLRGWNLESTFPPHCLLGTPGVEPIPGAELKAGDTPLVMRSFDPFSLDDTDGLLDEMNPDTVIVCGMPLEHSVRASVEGLIARRRQVRVALDAVAALKPAVAEELLQQWKEEGVEILSAALALRPPGSAAGP